MAEYRIQRKEKQPLEPSRVKEHLHAYILWNVP